MKLIIDTSVLMAVLLNEPERDLILGLTTGCMLFAPGSLPLEVGNCVSAAFRRDRLTLGQAQAVLKSFAKVSLQFKPIDLERAIEISHQAKIYAYDAYMIAAAEAERAHLFTLDNKLKKIAKSFSVKLLEV